MTRRIRPWFSVLGWAGVLFVLSSIPGNDFPQVPGAQTDKLVHGVLYLVLGALAVRGLRATTSLKRGGLIAGGLALATAYGITDELHQIFTPRRSCDWHDVVADAVGGLLGAALATRVFEPRQKQQKSTPSP